jgi:hypothetical protein
MGFLLHMLDALVVEQDGDLGHAVNARRCS